MAITMSRVQFRELNWVSDFKSALHLVRDWFEITSMIIPELYNNKSYYQCVNSKNTRNFLCQQLKKDNQNLRKTSE